MILREQWEEILADNELDELDLRDNRYHQVCMAMHRNYRGSKHHKRHFANPTQYIIDMTTYSRSSI